MAVQFTRPTLTVGGIIAGVVLTATGLLLFMRLIGVPEALVIAALCAIRH